MSETHTLAPGAWLPDQHGTACGPWRPHNNTAHLAHCLLCVLGAVPQCWVWRAKLACPLAVEEPLLRLAVAGMLLPLAAQGTLLPLVVSTAQGAGQGKPCRRTFLPLYA